MRVAVVGAGLAGLAAADALVAAGHEPIVLEARDRVGGRVHSRTLDNGAVVEMGAEFILPGCTEALALAERLGLGLWDKGMRYGRREPRGVEVPAGALETAVAAIDLALTAGDGEGESVRGLLARLDLEPGAREAILARAEVSAAASGDLVPAGELALLARVSDLPAPGIAGGNQLLAEALADAVGRERIHLGDPVRAITEDGEQLTVVTGAGELAADRCLIAVPASIIDRIDLRPSLAEPVAAALREIAYGHAAKLFVPLPGPVPLSATLAVPDRYWAWTASGADDGVAQPLVSAFAGSPQALGRLGVEAGAGRWAESLAALRPDLEIDPGRAVLSTWDDDEWVRGAYSVAAPAAAVEALTRPHGRIAFAGEHLGGEMSALMEGAIRSGRAAVAALLR
ncbi:MAG TPA: NAD(P)/FAD-dependent oxidoreductase [Solirubrobacterales bacterium]|nr:NAD(P)/FAD-dependent oxidoreductase [Solirubrobacterales bacterium]